MSFVIENITTIFFKEIHVNSSLFKIMENIYVFLWSTLV